MFGQILNTRRIELDMTFAALAERSGLSLPTVQRILADKQEPTANHLKALAEAMGMALEVIPKVPSSKLKLQQAHAKARRLVAMSQATAALEAQAVGQKAVKSLVDQTVQELLAKPKRLLWSE
jgi:transcriptional regulator with XRE-family HTH domain